MKRIGTRSGGTSSSSTATWSKACRRPSPRHPTSERSGSTRGAAVTERTNASTTGLLDPADGEWAVDLFDRLQVPKRLFAPLVKPGTVIGPVLPSIGLPARTEVTAAGSHDTASAVVAVPAEDDRFAYISSGTWSLVGVELEAPLISDAGRLANFTNEGGVDGRTRYLKNVSGLWLLSESMRTSELHDGGRSTPAEQSANPSAARRGSRRLHAGAALRPGGPPVPPAWGHADPIRRLARPSTSFTSSAVAPRTSCCASSRRTPPTGRCSQGRSRRRRSATSSSKRERQAWSPAHSSRSEASSAGPSLQRSMRRGRLRTSPSFRLTTQLAGGSISSRGSASGGTTSEPAPEDMSD